jgi:hypothetical protein
MKEKKLRSGKIVSLEIIERRIYFIRGEKVMIDADLAELYQVETRVLIQAVQRNRKRFPADFMFQLNEKEFANWRSQIVISNPKLKMGLRRSPYVFTEHGIAMLSSVLKSSRAVQVNIDIIRAFVRLRKMLVSHKNLADKIEVMERKYDKQFAVVFDILKHLFEPSPASPKRPMGFRTK